MSTPPQLQQPSRIHYDYLKSNQFRVLHVDGAWGGLTPTGLVNMVLYSERPPIPRQTTHDVAEDGSLSEVEELRDVRDAVAVRDMEVAAIMHPRVAAQLRDWLDAKVKEWDAIRAAVKEMQDARDTTKTPDSGTLDRNESH